MPETPFTPSKAAILALLDRIQQSPIFSRSKNYSKLLAYLVEKELQAIEDTSSPTKPPKEVEIAIDVFNKSTDFNSADDSTVRVHISNLRKKLDTYFDQAGNTESFRILLPTGEYRLVFKAVNTSAKSQPTNPEVVTTPQIDDTEKAKPTKPKYVYAMTLLIAFSLVIHFGLVLYPNQAQISQSKVSRNSTDALWADLKLQEKKDVLIVLGNEYNQVSNGVAQAYKHVLLTFEDPHTVSVRVSSQLTVKDIRQYNIIYIGDYRSMSKLGSFFKGSGFAITENQLTLATEESTQMFMSPQNTEGRYTDYGLFAKFNGPNKTKVFLIAGFTDAALGNFSRFLTARWGATSLQFKEKLAEHKIESFDNVEMLFKVSSLENMHLNQELVHANKVNHRKIWK
ncbi:hypothetical protein [Paraglaciecola sp.]|uniref:hypothetical protein n=1 Tax=Paraglaciecola sp. TaxID=1920173 RepID=UPI003EF8502B